MKRIFLSVRSTTIESAPVDDVTIYSEEIEQLISTLTNGDLGPGDYFVTDESWVSDFSSSEEDIKAASNHFKMDIQCDDTLVKLAKRMREKKFLNA